MKLYWQVLKLLFRKVILHKSNGVVIKDFAESMGVTYIKLAQILATQNYSDISTESDRKTLAAICDSSRPLKFSEVERILKQTYKTKLSQTFTWVEEKPLGSASVSQVHRARLKSGEEVVLKIRRPNIAKTIDVEIRQIRKLMHRFGRFIQFKNYSGGDHALELYLKWIKQEADFQHELQNLQTYREFAQKINRSVPNVQQIHLPKAYPELCSKDIIVMEFVRAKTINQLPLNPSNKTKIKAAINSYLKLSFEAMLSGGSMAFHGDPHPGNICIDDSGDMWLLDLGMLCTLNPAETKWCRDFFLAIYTGNDAKISQLLLQYGQLNSIESMIFREECRIYCQEVRSKDITNYFVDMMGVCLKHELVPPDFLFSLVKAFLCLNGISNFTGATLSAPELLQAQTSKYMMRRTFTDCAELLKSVVKLLPQTLAQAQSP